MCGIMIFTLDEGFLCPKICVYITRGILPTFTKLSGLFILNLA